MSIIVIIYLSLIVISHIQEYGLYDWINIHQLTIFQLYIFTLNIENC